MACYSDVLMEMKNFLQARTPLVILKTGERERAERLLSEITRDLKHEIWGYSTQRSLFKLSSYQSIEELDDPIKHISKMFKKKKGEICTIIDFGFLENDNMFTRDLLNCIYAAKENEGTLIIVTGGILWSRITGLGLLCSLYYPDYDERKNQILSFTEKYKSVFTCEWNLDDIELAAEVLKGFSEHQIENILSANLVKKKGLFKADILDLAEQKLQLYGSLDNVELIKVPKKINLYGLENMKDRVDEKKKIFFADYDELQKYGLEYPKGVLLTGIPGCGKSLSAKYIAKSFNLELYKFDLDTIFNKWVGESERRMKEALDYIDRMAPCVLWVDEIEKALSTSDDGNDTGKRILGQFLFWLQESKSRVFLVATANNITTLPPELFRKGRFSEVFFIDLPNRNERSSMLKSYINNYLYYDIKDDELASLAMMTKGFSYADIEASIKEVAQLFILDENFKVDFDSIKKSLESVVPYEKSYPEFVKSCRKWGQERAVQASKEGD